MLDLKLLFILRNLLHAILESRYAERKARLLNALGLPPRLSKKELVEAFNRLYTFEQLDELQLKILQE